MGLAMDAVGFYRTTSGSADTVFTAATVATGDSLTIRAFAPPATAHLERFMTDGSAASAVRVRSPLLHDNVEGIQLYPLQLPLERGLSRWVSQVLQPQDTLIAEMIDAASSGTMAAVISIAYDNLPGAAARLHRWADIANYVKSIKVLRVTMASGGAAGAWLDTAITTTENLLHANTDYAVLGFTTDTALCAVGIKGIDTGNLRVVGPGVQYAGETTDYFINESEFRGAPRIPVFNAANGPSTYVTAFGKASPTNANVQLYCAELAQTVG